MTLLAWIVPALAVIGVVVVTWRQVVHARELRADDEADARRMGADTVMFDRPPDFPEHGFSAFTAATVMVPVIGETGVARWVADDALGADPKPLSDEATVVLPRPAAAKRQARATAQMEVGELPPVRPKRRLKTVTDPLGEWVPGAHTMAEAAILGDVFACRVWKTVRPSNLGMTT